LTLHQNQGEDKLAFPNWGRLKRRPDSLREGASPKVIDAIKYVLEHPPQVELAVDGRAEFCKRDLKGDTENEQIAETLKRIRNNLFHGGKRPYTDRDRKLVNAGLEIIER
jgi:hypothetical protein